MVVIILLYKRKEKRGKSNEQELRVFTFGNHRGLRKQGLSCGIILVIIVNTEERQSLYVYLKKAGKWVALIGFID
jgi:predicted neutral ceramidase superfamily lipid hydrolase